MSDKTRAPYLLVAETFRRLIAEGEWPVGSRLPSRDFLGETYQVGENVIRRAQELLITEGLLEGRPGAGTYVRAPKERLRMLRCPAPGYPSAPLAPRGHLHLGRPDHRQSPRPRSHRRPAGDPAGRALRTHRVRVPR